MTRSTPPPPLRPDEPSPPDGRGGERLAGHDGTATGAGSREREPAGHAFVERSVERRAFVDRRREPRDHAAAGTMERRVASGSAPGRLPATGAAGSAAPDARRDDGARADGARSRLTWGQPASTPPAAESVREELERMSRALQRARAAATAAERQAQAARAEAAEARREAEAARREATQAARAKGEFLATMSHELRTPLNAIGGYADLLELGVVGPLTAAQRDYLARLRASSRHLLGLVQDVLDLARVDAGALAVTAERLPAGPALRGVTALARAVGGERPPQLHCVSPDPRLTYVGDEHRVRQVLLALLSNACKFTPADGTVTLRAERRAVAPWAADDAPAAASGWVVFEVRDTGPGIPPELRERIFEPFVQGDGSRTRTAGGTGLGLALARRLARRMAGEVTVESTPGAGATFSLWLPAAVDDEPRA